MTVSSSVTPPAAPTTAPSSWPTWKTASSVVRPNCIRRRAEYGLPEIAFSASRHAPVARASAASCSGGLISEARWKGYRTLRVTTGADNHADAGARQQVRRASAVPPWRIHRHDRSDARTPEVELADGSRAPFKAGARGAQLQLDLLEADLQHVRESRGLKCGRRPSKADRQAGPLVLKLEGRRSGAGALVVAEAADDAAFDHDRALRTLFAGDHAGRGDTRCWCGPASSLRPERRRAACPSATRRSRPAARDRR